MPLPDSNATWPPPMPGAAKMAEHSAWYAGDADTLQAVYAGRSAPRSRPSQHAGGVVGAVSRWWWGQPPASNEQRSKLHVPLAADLCGTSADLLFSEPVKFRTEDTKLGEALAAMQRNGLDAQLCEAAELQAALGGVYLRNVWDRDLSPMPWSDPVHADMAVPTFRWGRLAEVTFWQVLPHERLTYRLLEHHAPGSITYALYEGREGNLGTRVPLEKHPESQHLAALANRDGVVSTGVQRLTAVYVPNMLPNRLDRGSHLGRSDLQGVEPFLDALDEAYSSWRRDIRLSKGRLHVPASYIDSDGPGQGGVFDTDREVYVAIPGALPPRESGLAIHAEQFAIRVEEHSRTCQEWTKTIIEAAGYSTQSLTSDGGGAVTATEVRAHERRSLTTRGKKSRYWSPQLLEHMRTAVELANANLSAGLTLDDTLAVEFQDGVQESPEQIGQTLQLLRNAEAASTKVRVQMLHPDWADTDVDAEVAAIMRESAIPQVGLPDDAGL